MDFGFQEDTFMNDYNPPDISVQLMLGLIAPNSFITQSISAFQLLHRELFNGVSKLTYVCFGFELLHSVIG